MTKLNANNSRKVKYKPQLMVTWHNENKKEETQPTKQMCFLRSEQNAHSDYKFLERSGQDGKIHS